MKSKNMDEELLSFSEPEPKYISVCKCLLSDDGSSEQVIIPERKQKMLTTVSRTESYIRERRIPELILFFFTKVLAQRSNTPIAYLEKLLDDCMLFRAGHRVAPVLYEIRHLQAIVKSFDPGQRGWLSAGQVRRIYATLGLSPEENIEERIPCDVVLSGLVKTQETELFNLLSTNIYLDEKTIDSKSESTIL